MLCCILARRGRCCFSSSFSNPSWFLFSLLSVIFPSFFLTHQKIHINFSCTKRYFYTEKYKQLARFSFNIFFWFYFLLKTQQTRLVLKIEKYFAIFLLPTQHKPNHTHSHKCAYIQNCGTHNYYCCSSSNINFFFANFAYMLLLLYFPSLLLFWPKWRQLVLIILYIFLLISIHFSITFA